tara:strand:+ start:88 stop:588 length:501 start_codon:yes stop_codon:yes gene_type:complete
VIDYITTRIDKISDLFGVFVSWMMICLVINVAVVVLLRYFFSIGFIWMQELYIWFHSLAFLLGAGYTLLHNGHVRIDVIYRNLSERSCAIINCLGTLVLALPVLHLIYTKSLPMILRSWSVWEGSVEAGGLPGVYMFKTLIAVFAAVFALQFTSLFLKNLKIIISK